MSKKRETRFRIQSKILNLNEPSSPWMASNVQWARCLKKHQLGGVIFGTTNITMGECLSKQLFGLPSQHFLYVKNIEPGTPLFLFNYSERKLYGIYEAASAGKMYIDSYAWTVNGSEKTKYPAQVQIRVRQQYQALDEQQFKPIIIDNYFSKSRIWFELDHVQATQLIAKFSALPVITRTPLPKSSPVWTTVKPRLPSENKREESKASEHLPLMDDSNDSIPTSTTSDGFPYLDGNNQFLEASYSNQMVSYDEKDLIYMKLKEIVLKSDYADANMVGRLEEAQSGDYADCKKDTLDNTLMALGETNEENSFDPNDYPTIISKIYKEMEELKTFKLEHIHRMVGLGKKPASVEQEIDHLNNKCAMLESISNPSMKLAGKESRKGCQLNPKESIFIMGGFDGDSWSSALYSFSPSYDVLLPLKPMSCARSYASVAELNGEIYTFGGAGRFTFRSEVGSIWYDTVESYNVANDEWILRPPMQTKKGCLGGAALNGKLFAVGGGNAIDSFSEVEMLDLDVGRWIFARSMLQKRFAVAAVELNGAIYAAGGYDGNEYLKTAERYDPREQSWTSIGSMNTKKGSHSLVVMNEKIYSIGGYDGQMMVPNIEIYEPRKGTWTTGDPMNQNRGYLCASVLNESIYAIGGVLSGEEIVDKIECYKDGQGWQTTNLKAIGKRCYASAIVLGSK